MAFRRRNSGGDPRWIFTKFGGKCKGCEAAVHRGERVFYYPSPSALYCEKDSCGGKASRDFESFKFDDAQIGAC